jgi:hypothetical protein
LFSQFCQLAAGLAEVKEAASSFYIVGVGLLIELDVVSHNRRCQLGNLREVKGLKNLVDMWKEVLHCLLEIGINCLSCLW